MAKRILIIGGGLAGIAASAALRDRGHATILIERRSRLGGRASSFDDPASGLTLDNCQHVLLGCCTSLIALYKRLGVLDRIRFTDTIRFADQTGRHGELRSLAGLGPLHLGPSMVRFPLLTPGQKVRIAGAMAAMKLISPRSAEGMDDVPFGRLLRRWGQSADTIARFWDPIISSALNAPAAESSSRYALKVFQDGFLAGRDSFRMGVPACRLAELYQNIPATRIILDERVMELSPDRPSALLPSGERLEADAVIVATAPDSARRLLGGIPAMSAVVANLGRLHHGTIIGAHLFFDRPVMPEAHLSLMGLATQWLFRHDAQGRHIHAVISAAPDSLASLDADAMSARIARDVRIVLPLAATATLGRSVIVKERRATFSALPGADALRPAQITPIPWLFLAGDYTRTAWPGTMEGAVRSGELAAKSVGD